MRYTVGQKLLWVPDNKQDKKCLVEVVGLRRSGAKLSNGWVADEDGYAIGTERIPGGRVYLADEAHALKAREGL